MHVPSILALSDKLDSALLCSPPSPLLSEALLCAFGPSPAFGHPWNARRLVSLPAVRLRALGCPQRSWVPIVGDKSWAQTRNNHKKPSASCRDQGSIERSPVLGPRPDAQWSNHYHPVDAHCQTTHSCASENFPCIVIQIAQSAAAQAHRRRVRSVPEANHVPWPQPRGAPV
ncbi:hypothetical protein CC78DRAFT_575890 [Lojkania enalia]|uniref:Uncharacterized protein n=1 Tax=Lojkania enalia TaxID=147567 RepID=A0A9P4KGN4_9PLEO|nr:hypothetical protein CC78DRAFT_575890 [Didymosphaeria enalia]